MYYIKIICETAFYVFCGCAIWYIYNLIKTKEFFKNRNFFITLCISLLLSIPHMPILFGYETTNIGDFYEAREYTAKYYVIMSREPNSKTGRKEYTLPAEIERRLDEGVETFHSTTYYLDGETYEQGVDALNYHINYLYFPNGGYLTFNYDEAYENPEYSILLLDKETKVTDYHGDEYYITLTKKKAE